MAKLGTETLDRLLNKIDQMLAQAGGPASPGARVYGVCGIALVEWRGIVAELLENRLDMAEATALRLRERLN